MKPPYVLGIKDRSAARTVAAGGSYEKKVARKFGAANVLALPLV
jgi:hypothetical protein